jgi:hypothetical protein
MPTAEWATLEHDFWERRFPARCSVGSISVRGVIVDGSEVSSVGGDGDDRDDGSWSDAAALLPAIERGCRVPTDPTVAVKRKAVKPTNQLLAFFGPHLPRHKTITVTSDIGPEAYRCVARVSIARTLQDPPHRGSNAR